MSQSKRLPFIQTDFYSKGAISVIYGGTKKTLEVVIN